MPGASSGRARPVAARPDRTVPRRRRSRRTKMARPSDPAGRPTQRTCQMPNPANLPDARPGEPAGRPTQRTCQMPDPANLPDVCRAHRGHPQCDCDDGAGQPRRRRRSGIARPPSMRRGGPTKRKFRELAPPTRLGRRLPPRGRHRDHVRKPDGVFGLRGPEMPAAGRGCASPAVKTAAASRGPAQPTRVATATANSRRARPPIKTPTTSHGRV
jgi:hypothetical protein